MESDIYGNSGSGGDQRSAGPSPAVANRGVESCLVVISARRGQAPPWRTVEAGRLAGCGRCW